MAVAGSSGGRGRGRKLTGSTPSTSRQEELPAGPLSASKGRWFRLRGRSHTNEEQLRAPIWGGYEAGKDAVVAIAGYLQDQASRQRKPENQNHAVIFTRGECLQTIDMNQEHYMEEVLKMRNLLEEFLEKHDGVRYPLILGVREHIFTGSVSSLAWFMSNQEMSFVTIGQRVLANPLRAWFHYGHPDIFDRLFLLARGGIGKASKIISLSEDIFAGFNSTLREGNVTHHEYMQVGKGRDVGLN